MTTESTTTIDTIPEHHFTVDMLHVPNILHCTAPLNIKEKLPKKYLEKLVLISQFNMRTGVSAFAFPQIGINFNVAIFTAKKLNVFGYFSNIRIVQPEQPIVGTKKVNVSYKCTTKPNTISNEIVEFPIKIEYNKIDYAKGTLSGLFQYTIQHHQEPGALQESFSLYHAVKHCLGLSGTLLPDNLKGDTTEP